MSALQTLWLNDNHFEGTEFWAEHEDRDATQKDITQTVSVDHHSLTFFFDFSRSLFAGELPESIGNLSALKELRLASNRFSGKSNNQKDAVHAASLLGTGSSTHFSNS